MQRNRHSYREADGDTQERGDEVHVLLQEVVDLPQAVLGGDRHPLQHGSSSGGGGGFVPPTVLPQPQIEMEARGAHSIARLGCSVGSSPFFLLLAATWEDKHLQYFQLLQYAYDFLGMMRFGLWGMCARTGKCGHAKAFFFPPTGKRKEGNEKTEKQSTP